MLCHVGANLVFAHSVYAHSVYAHHGIDMNIPPGVISAVSKQPSVCRVGANLVFALFLCGVRTQMARMARMGAVRTMYHA